MNRDVDSDLNSFALLRLCGWFNWKSKGEMDRMNVLVRAIGSLFLAFACPVAAASDSIAVLPSQVTLNGPGARQAIIVEKIREGVATGEITEGITFVPGDAKIVKIENGVAIPVANGTTTLTASASTAIATANVTVTGFDKPWEWSFRNDVQPVLTRAGCNSGACHGASAGKSGFHLSLRGYDDDGDFRALTRQFMGRRIDPSDPGAA